MGGRGGGMLLALARSISLCALTAVSQLCSSDFCGPRRARVLLPYRASAWSQHCAPRDDQLTLCPVTHFPGTAVVLRSQGHLSVVDHVQTCMSAHSLLRPPSSLPPLAPPRSLCSPLLIPSTYPSSPAPPTPPRSFNSPLLAPLVPLLSPTLAPQLGSAKGLPFNVRAAGISERMANDDEDEGGGGNRNSAFAGGTGGSMFGDVYVGMEVGTLLGDDGGGGNEDLCLADLEAIGATNTCDALRDALFAAAATDDTYATRADSADSRRLARKSSGIGFFSRMSRTTSSKLVAPSGTPLQQGGKHVPQMLSVDEEEGGEGEGRGEGSSSELWRLRAEFSKLAPADVGCTEAEEEGGDGGDGRDAFPPQPGLAEGHSRQLSRNSSFFGLVTPHDKPGEIPAATVSNNSARGGRIGHRREAGGVVKRGAGLGVRGARRARLGRARRGRGGTSASVALCNRARAELRRKELAQHVVNLLPGWRSGRRASRAFALLLEAVWPRW